MHCRHPGGHVWCLARHLRSLEGVIPSPYNRDEAEQNENQQLVLDLQRMQATRQTAVPTPGESDELREMTAFQPWEKLVLEQKNLNYHQQMVRGSAWTGLRIEHSYKAQGRGAPHPSVSCSSRSPIRFLL